MTTDPGDALRLGLALETIRAAGALALRSFQDSSLKVDTKRDRSVVTEADRGAERLLRAAIETTFPDDRIVGEEYGEKAGGSGWTWYLDPIDGTQAFVRGCPLWGTLIGIEKNGASRVGAIFLPALGELVYAARGTGTYWIRGILPERDGFSAGLAPVRAKVSPVTTLKDAMFCTTWMKSFEDVGRVDLFGKLCSATGVFRGWGDCYGYALVATGRAEVMVDPVLAVWDAAPLLITVEEAGGRYTTLDGKATIHGGSGIATNGVLHDEILKLCAQ